MSKRSYRYSGYYIEIAVQHVGVKHFAGTAAIFGSPESARSGRSSSSLRSMCSLLAVSVAAHGKFINGVGHNPGVLAPACGTRCSAIKTASLRVMLHTRSSAIQLTLG
jgi:hypothetical protein